MQRRDDDGVEAAAVAKLVPLEGKRVLPPGGRRLQASSAAGSTPRA
jgi:hypothetical protein